MPRYTSPKILDAEYLLESANDSARHFRNIYAVYLTLMIYIFIIVLSTEQELLFSAGDKQLPLVHIRVPIVAFFTWMPWALLVLHFYLLIQVTFLSDKVCFYKQEINDHLKSRDIRKAKMLLASVPLVHILVEERAKWKHAMLYLIVFVSLAVFPLIVLIRAQITFLPYQSELITWSHRIVILIDVLMLWYFGHHTLGSHKWKTIWINSIAGLLGILILAFAVIFINFPGNKIYNHATAGLYELKWVKKIMPTNYFYLPDSKLVKKEPSPELLAAHIIEQMGNETSIKPGSSIWCQYADPLDLKDRNFREAQLEDATFCEAILQNTDLTDANLRDAKLISANLVDATLTNADLTDANLTSARLREANLTSVDFTRADLTDASPSSANLTDAVLIGTNLTNAKLWYANLTNAQFWYANLTNAQFWYANLTDVKFEHANLTGAYLGDVDLTSTDLSFVNLTSAKLREANLTSSELNRANLTSAELDRANLTSAILWVANLTDSGLWGANLKSANLRAANLTSATLIYSNLTSADLSWTNLSKTNFSNAVLDNETTLDLIWVWKSSDSEEEYFPIGNPKGWNDTLKPEYLCPEGFDISNDIYTWEYINNDYEVRREELKAQLEQIMDENCEKY